MNNYQKPARPIQSITFGCRLNTFETEVMEQKAREAGLENIEGGAILINTCAVTSEAVRQAKQQIRRARRQNPKARIIVTGCAAQTEPDTFAEMDEVDLIIGNEDKLHSQNYRALPDFGVNDLERVRVNDIMSVRETAPHMIDGMGGRVRAFVQVQNGCDHRCTFCIIPFGRGNSRSVPMGEVVSQIRRLVELGHKEIVITGVDITSYGGDLPGKPKLGNLIQVILSEVSELPRLRLSSIDSIEVDEPLMEAIALDQRLMPHLHLSVQSGDNMILKRMKRRHLREQTIEFCQRVKSLRPDMVFGADLIAGFPTENEQMFENTLKIIDECDLTFIHAFPYSIRPGTPAAQMPQVPKTVIKQRAKILRQKSNLQLISHLNKQLNTLQKVLVEPGNTGRNEQYVTVIDVPGLVGEIVELKIAGSNGKALIAGVADEIAIAKTMVEPDVAESVRAEF